MALGNAHYTIGLTSLLTHHTSFPFPIYPIIENMNSASSSRPAMFTLLAQVVRFSLAFSWLLTLSELQEMQPPETSLATPFRYQIRAWLLVSCPLQLLVRSPAALNQSSLWPSSASELPPSSHTFYLAQAQSSSALHCWLLVHAEWLPAQVLNNPTVGPIQIPPLPISELIPLAGIDSPIP